MFKIIHYWFTCFYFKKTGTIPRYIKEQDINQELVDYIFNKLGEDETINCMKKFTSNIVKFYITIKLTEEEYVRNKFFHIFISIKFKKYIFSQFEPQKWLGFIENDNIEYIFNALNKLPIYLLNFKKVNHNLNYLYSFQSAENDDIKDRELTEVVNKSKIDFYCRYVNDIDMLPILLKLGKNENIHFKFNIDEELKNGVIDKETYESYVSRHEKKSNGVKMKVI
jgi:hypothetical protein